MVTNFFQRWSSRKLAAREEQPESVANERQEVSESSTQFEADVQSNDLNEKNVDKPIHDSNDNEIIDVDVDKQLMPTLQDVANVSFDTGVASFMKSGVEKSVKKAALRKLFHSDEFNYVSDMDDCTEDFSNLKALDSSVTKQLRNWINEAADKLEEASDKLPLDSSGEHVELESSDLNCDCNQLIKIEKEAEVPVGRESIPTSAEGKTSDKAQEDELVNEGVVIAEKDERSA